MQGEIKPTPGKIETKQTSENSEKPKIHCWVEGTFGDYIWTVYLLQVQYSMDNH